MEQMHIYIYVLPGGSAAKIGATNDDLVLGLHLAVLDELAPAWRQANHGVTSQLLVLLGLGGHQRQVLGGDDLVRVDVIPHHKARPVNYPATCGRRGGLLHPRGLAPHSPAGCCHIVDARLESLGFHAQSPHGAAVAGECCDFAARGGGGGERGRALSGAASGRGAKCAQCHRGRHGCGESVRIAMQIAMQRNGLLKPLMKHQNPGSPNAEQPSQRNCTGSSLTLPR